MRHEGRTEQPPQGFRFEGYELRFKTSEGKEVVAEVPAKGELARWVRKVDVALWLHGFEITAILALAIWVWVLKRRIGRR